MHDAEHEGDEPTEIKVTDRRMFDRDGNFRDSASAAQATSAEAGQPAERAVEPRAATTADDGTEPMPSVATPVAPAAAANAPAESLVDDTAETDTPEASPLRFADEALMRFIEEQYIGGLLALGAMPEPQSGQIVEDLDLAQVRIEVLGMLRERAGDSLPAEARQGLDDVMYQLRMAYLQKRKVVKL